MLTQFISNQDITGFPIPPITAIMIVLTKFVLSQSPFQETPRGTGANRIILIKVSFMEEEVSKQKFKERYFTYATTHSGWTKEYWDFFYEDKEDQLFFFSPPTSPTHTRMFIVTEGITHRMIFLTEESEESFFNG